MPDRRRIHPQREDVFYDDEDGGRYRGEGEWSGDGDRSAERLAGGARVQKELEKRRAAGEPLEPVIPSNNRTLSTTFWGQAWNRNLMSYSDYETRMPRGRASLRAGRVFDLSIQEGKVTAAVADTRIYDVSILIQPLDGEEWEDLKKRCRGKIAGVVEMLSGSLSDEVMREVTLPGHGLFPAPGGMKMNCTCPDTAGLCKHAAAVLYGVGTKLDDQPALLFTLRGVNPEEMVAANAAEAIQDLTAPATPDPARDAALQGVDLCALFDIDGEE